MGCDRNFLDHRSSSRQSLQLSSTLFYKCSWKLCVWEPNSIEYFGRAVVLYSKLGLFAKSQLVEISGTVLRATLRVLQRSSHVLSAASSTVLYCTVLQAEAAAAS